MPSPICTVKDGAGSAQTTSAVATVTPGNTVTLSLADSTGVSTWSIQCIYTDETTTAASVNSGLTVNGTTKTATFTAPAAGKAMIFQSVINGGKNANNVTDATYTTTFKVATLSSVGTYVVAANETVEHGSYGWIPVLNAASRNPLSYAVYTFSGTLFYMPSALTGYTIMITNSSAVSFVVSPSAATGTTVKVIQYGSGQITFSADTGATLYSRLSYKKTSAQFAVASLDVVGNSTGTSAVWVLSGDLSA